MYETPSEVDPALEGLAARTVLALLPQQAQILVRLSTDSRRQVLRQHVGYLADAGVVSQAEAQRLTGTVAGEFSADDAPATATDVMDPVSVSVVLAAALRAPVLTDNFLDDLWVALVTAWGAVVGEGIGGPVGSVIGATLAHEWAQEHPPSTWFE